MTYDLSLSPPARSLQLVEEMRSRATQPEIQELVALLECDPISTAHLLRQVNSPLSTPRQGVSSIDRAVTILGFEAVAITVFVETHADRPAGANNRMAQLAYEYVVKTGVTAGFIAHTLARFLKMERHSAARTAALIHQLGRMGLLSVDSAMYTPLWKETTTPSGRPVALPPGIGRETAHFQTDYTRHGEQLAVNWKLPPNLAESVRYHADPERAEDADRDVVLVVAVSQYAARTMFESGKDLERDQGTERFERATALLAQAHGLTRTKLEELLEDARKSAYERANGIDL